MFSHSNYWPRSTTKHSNYNMWDYDKSSSSISESQEATEDSYSSKYASRARSASPPVDRGTRGISVTRSILDFSTPYRLSRALSVPRETLYHQNVDSSKHRSYQVLSSHDVVSKPFYRSFYYIKPRPDTSLYTPRAYSRTREASVPRAYSRQREDSVPPRAYSRAREASVPRAYSRLREGSVPPRAYSRAREESVSYSRQRETSLPREFREVSHHQPHSQLNRQSQYGGRYFSKYSSPLTKQHYYRTRYPFVSSTLFLPRYYPGTLNVPYMYASSRLHV